MKDVVNPSRSKFSFRIFDTHGDFVWQFDIDFFFCGDVKNH